MRHVARGGEGMLSSRETHMTITGFATKLMWTCGVWNGGAEGGMIGRGMSSAACGTGAGATV